MTKAGRERLDEALVARGLAETRSQARALIMAGAVRAGGRVLDKPGMPAPAGELEVAGGGRFVSRGGEKLARALGVFGVDPAGLVCADLGASTGGFTDCLLQHGAARVYAVDVGYGQLHWKLRQDPRVVAVERTNARHLEALPEPVALVTADLSFISLALILPVIRRLLAPGGAAAVLVKPQFEAGREAVGKGGVVRDPAVHRAVLERFVEDARGAGFAVVGLTPSPLRGPAGNVEFLAHLRRDAPDAGVPAGGLAEAALAEVPAVVGGHAAGGA
ncbi:MAG TPA: TlyA family RNA methyltransferase [Thermomicrobiales bacterium]|nr:TlyA family RNA methyltransferase [Thermomicrobiales bacterium]